MDWGNVKAWLIAYWAGEMRSEWVRETFDGRDFDCDLVMHAFGMVRILKALSWETIERVLDEYREGVAAAAFEGDPFNA